MEKIYEVKNVRVTADLLIIQVGDQEYRFPLQKVSDKLYKASDAERTDFRISPSGYGIHWRLIDEDLSINRLLRDV